LTLTRKSRSLPDLYQEAGKASVTAWRQNHVTKVKDPSFSGSWPMWRPGPSTLRGYQFTDSENHVDFGRPNRPSYEKELQHLYEQVFVGVAGTFNKGKRKEPNTYDVGGEFLTQKVTVDAPWSHRQHITGLKELNFTFDVGLDYQGPIYVGIPSPGIVLPPFPSGSSLEQLGATAISRCAPTNNVAQAANFLIELRTEGLPHLFGMTLVKERALKARSLGDEYLNKEFGWDPLVGDLKHIAKQVMHAHNVLQQYEYGSGRVTRRGYGFPVEESETTTLLGNANANVGSYFGTEIPGWPYGDWTNILFAGGSTDQTYRKRHTKKEVWFSGAFTYHLPAGYNSRLKMVADARKAQTLLGLDLTPEVLWNAAPWTWAIDWFSNTGDVVANLSDWATDGLVMKYGYVMEHITITDTYFCMKRGGLSDPRAIPSPIVVTLERKRRVKASPFGFGLTWSGLTPRQIAISAALGLTRGIKGVF
jgi:hypothetical protein